MVLFQALPCFVLQIDELIKSETVAISLAPRTEQHDWSSDGTNKTIV